MDDDDDDDDDNHNDDAGGGRVPQHYELATRGPHVMLGYWNRPAATAAVLSKGGWLRTGDLGRRFRSQRFFWFVGRRKDMIKSGGENVFAAEVETAIMALPRPLPLALDGGGVMEVMEVATAAAATVRALWPPPPSLAPDAAGERPWRPSCSRAKQQRQEEKAAAAAAVAAAAAIVAAEVVVVLVRGHRF